MNTLYDNNKYHEGELFPKFRIILLGNSQVGKTSLIMQFMNRNFREEYFPSKEIV